MSICSQFYLVYSIFFAISCVKTNKLPFCQIISIYALLAEGDLLEGYGNDNPGAFQSTPSSRRATYSSSFARWASSISIHALLTEGDDRFHGPLSHVSHFNPRPPHGGRQHCCFRRSFLHYFNPRPPHGGRPVWWIYGWHFIHISIHALLTEGDEKLPLALPVFNISIHALLTEGDDNHNICISQICLFQSTPSSRRATRSNRTVLGSRSNFNPRPPHGGRQQK